MIPCGYILQPRCIKDSWIAHAPPVTRETWSYLLRNACFVEKKYNGFTLKRGQLFRSYQQIREDLRWYKGCTIERYTVDQMKHCMKALMNHQMITLTKAPRGNVITICNYDYYQDPGNYESTGERSSSPPANAPAVHQQSPAIIKEGEERKNNNMPQKCGKTISGKCPEKYHHDFEVFWKAYPARNGKKNNKKGAFIEWWVVIRDKNITNDFLLRAVEKFKCSLQDQFPPDAATWLNNNRWEDEVGMYKDNIAPMSTTREFKSIEQRKAEEIALYGQLISDWGEIERSMQK